MGLSISRTAAAGGVGAQRVSLSSVDGTEPIGRDALLDLQTRVDFSDEDDLLDVYITAAREYFEEETGRQLIQATYTLTLDRFPPTRHEAIRIPRPPLQSVSSITYTDVDGTPQTWAVSEYTVQTYDGPTARPGRVFPNEDETYPTDVADVPGAVTVTFVAGYADSSVPKAWQVAMLMLIADMYAIREAQVTGTIISDNKTAMRIINRATLVGMA